jgi:hypothetical protein
MSKRESRSYHITTGPVRELVVHARRKRLDHAEIVARRLSAKYPDETYRIWEERERDSDIGRIRSSSSVATYKAGDRQ